MKRTILVVDDDADISWAIAHILTEAGYAVVSATDGREAFRKLRDAPAPPAMILLDLMMPNMDGWQFLAELHKHEPQSRIPVVVTTAGRIDEEQVRALGGTALLRKPFEASALLDLARALSTANRPTRSRAPMKTSNRSPSG